MTSQIVFAVLGMTTLLGAALFWAIRADRRRESRRQRLQAIAAAVPSGNQPGLSFRRPLPDRGMRRLFLLPAGLWTRFDAALAATGNRIGVPHLALAAAIAAIAAIVLASGLMALNPVLVIAAAVAAAAGAAALLLRFMQSRYQNRFTGIFPDALDLLARAVRAGLPIAEAMEVVAQEMTEPVGSEFRKILEEMRIGVDQETALQHAADRIRVPEFRFYVVALTLQRRTGGALAETLGNLSNIIRRRKELWLKARALTAESRASAYVLAIIPFVVGGLISLVNRQLMQVLWLDPRGRLMVGYAVLSVLAGFLVMTLMIRRSLR